MSSLSDTTLWQKGEALMQLGEEKERSKQKEEAFQCFQQGLELMVEALRSMPTNTTKQRRQQIVNVYMNHAEQLKAELYGDVVPPMNNNNYNKEIRKRHGSYTNNNKRLSVKKK